MSVVRWWQECTRILNYFSNSKDLRPALVKAQGKPTLTILALEGSFQSMTPRAKPERPCWVKDVYWGVFGVGMWYSDLCRRGAMPPVPGGDGAREHAGQYHRELLLVLQLTGR
jgi:hypothetical protein